MTVRYDDKGKIFTNIITKETVPAIIQTVTHRIRGSVHVRADQRIKDELNQPEHFLAVTRASVFDADGKVLYQSEFIAINRDRIVWVIPDADLFDEISGESQEQR